MLHTPVTSLKDDSASQRSSRRLRRRLVSPYYNKNIVIISNVSNGRKTGASWKETDDALLCQLFELSVISGVPFGFGASKWPQMRKQNFFRASGPLTQFLD